MLKQETFVTCFIVRQRLMLHGKLVMDMYKVVLDTVSKHNIRTSFQFI